MDNNNIEFYYEYVLKLVQEAGKVVKEAKNIVIEMKDSDFDIVTEYDRKVEETLIKQIKNKFPNHKAIPTQQEKSMRTLTHRFIGEEESSLNNSIPQLTHDPTWIIDPIDGTANFVRQMPITCISVGLTINKEQVLGIIYNPFMDELYTAIKGKGAYLNGKQIHCSNVKEISKSVLNYELSLARNSELTDLYLYRFDRLIRVIQGVRSMGCAALGLCYVARGATDAYQCDGLYPWDVAAGSLIVTEAGGYICSSNGEKFDLMKPNFIATATKELADQYVAIEKQADEERLCKTR